MEVLVLLLAEEGLSLALGLVGGMLYSRYRLWKIKRHAPSAEEVGSFFVKLTQEHFDRLPKEENDVCYFIVPPATPDASK